MATQAFKTYYINYTTNLFRQLSTSAVFERVNANRQGANLSDTADGLISLVRTTTVCETPNQRFTDLHRMIATDILRLLGMPDLVLNNALLELYTSRYCRMGYHSDLAMDLADESMICVFSCYSNPNTRDVRTLRVMNKTTSVVTDIRMEHNSVIAFSTQTNCEYQHQIILERPCTNDQWLGITFRQAKTHIKFEDNIPILHPSGQPLTLATDAQRREFFRNRRLENTMVGHTYPDWTFTISPGDLMPVV